jgi:hypothetical protein
MAPKKHTAAPSAEAVAARDVKGALAPRQLPSLRLLGDEFDALLAEVAAADGDLPPELEARFDALAGDIRIKIQKWGLHLIDREAQITLAQAEADFYGAEADRLAALVQRATKEREKSERYLLVLMRRLGIDDVEGPLCVVQRRQKPPKVVGLVDPATLAAMFLDEQEARYVRHVPEAFELNKNEVLEVWRSNQALLKHATRDPVTGAPVTLAPLTAYPITLDVVVDEKLVLL